MKKAFIIAAGLMFCTLFAGCKAGEDEPDMKLPHIEKEMTVGSDIRSEDITDFYYTVENINYGAYYQRYRFYTEDGKLLFFHETREREDYGPCTEEDAVSTGTLELDDDSRARFFELVSGGKVRSREDSADSGGTGPWLYLYWTGDRGVYQQFSFGSYETEEKFEDLCEELAGYEGYRN